MTDLELLELAARAAGYLNWTPTQSCLFIETGHSRGSTGFYWDPLTDDGDALRLAERCSLTVCMNGTGTVSASDDYNKDDVFATQSIYECGGSRITATRRAIVRAAAEIGKAMEKQK